MRGGNKRDETGNEEMRNERKSEKPKQKER